MTLPQHEIWMRRAFELASKGCYQVSPNPLVGACLVKNKRLISEGYHAKYGGDHAEIVALKKAGSKRGATLYVTLEPCSTWGKTPPCVQAIIDSGIREVVIGVLDSNPAHQGRGVAALQKAGIKVTHGVMQKEIQKQNESFFKYIQTKRPFVILKMAQSLDGKIATHEKKSRWITGVAARNYVQELRASCDAILIGKNTLHTDNPSLIPVGYEKKCREGKPWRVVLDPRFEASNRSKVFKRSSLTLRVVSENELIKKAKSLDQFSGTLLPVSEKLGRICLPELLKKLGNLGVAKLLIEGGGELAWSFLSEKLVDELVWITAPKIIGGRAAVTSVEGLGVSDPNQAINVKMIESKPLGEDWLFIAKPI